MKDNGLSLIKRVRLLALWMFLFVHVIPCVMIAQANDSHEPALSFARSTADSIPRDSVFREVIDEFDSIPDTARTELLQALAASFKGLSAETTFDFSLLFNRFGPRGEVLDVWNRCIEHISTIQPTDTLSLAKSWNYYGTACHSRGMLDDAKRCFLNVIALIPPATIDEELGVAHNNLATIYNSQSNPGAALPNYLRARDIFIELLGENHYYIAIIRNNIGQVYDKLGRYEEQIKEQETARDIYLITLGRNNQLTGNIFINLGIVYRNTAQRDKAIAAFEEAKSIRETLGDHEGVIAAMSETASCMAAFPDTWDASDVRQMQKAIIDQGVEYFGEDSKALRSVYNNYSLSLLAAGEYEEALQYVNRAIRVSYTGFEPSSKWDVPDHSMILSPAIHDVRLFENKGYILNKIYKRDQDTVALQFACLSYAVGDSLLEILKTELLNGLSRKHLIREAGDFYINAATAALNRYLLTGQRNHLDQAYIWFEKSRNWELITAYVLSEHGESVLGGDIIRQISSLHSQSSTKQANANSSDSLDQLIDIEIENLSNQHPEYFRYVYNYNVAPLDSIIAFSKKHNIQWLHYYVLSGGGSASLLVTPDTLAVISTENGADSTSKYKVQLVDKILAREWDFTSETDKLSQYIFGSHQGLIKPGRLYVSSAGNLQGIPLDILPLGATHDSISPEDYAKQYLINDLTISRFPSGTFGLKIFRDGFEVKSSTFIAPEYHQDPLEYGEIEVTASSRKLDGKLRQGNVSGAQVVSALGTSDLVHFAGHSFAHPRDMDSIFLLIGNGNDTFHLSDLLNVRSKANLVVLSSCESSMGTRSYEGNIGLTYGLSFAGSPNVISSIWPASDRETGEIFSRFYDCFREGGQSDECLRQARLEYLADAPLPGQHPYYWATWSYYGHPVMYKQGNWWGQYLLLLAFIVFGVALVAQRHY